MIRKRLGRLATVLSAATLALLLVGAGVALAKPPAWAMAVTAIPTSVAPGNYAAYKVTIKNNGSSNIAKLFLTDSRTESPYSVTPSTGCTATGVLNCSLGALSKGKSTTRIVVYKTPSSGSSFDVTFAANTSGVSFSDGGTSHGDTLRGNASTALNGSSNFAGGYVVDANAAFATGSGDSQQTTVYPPEGGIGVTITEGGAGNPCGGNAIGQLANLNVDDGNTLPVFLTTIKIPTSGLPDELELSQVTLCHQYDGGSAVLLPRCASSDAAPADGVACFSPKWVGPYHADHERHGETDADDWTWLVMDMWDVQNGNLRGGY